MIISHKYQFIFVKTAKTAGTSIETYLSPICGSQDVFTPFSVPEPNHQPRNYGGWFNPIPELIKRVRVSGTLRGAGWRATLRDLSRKRHFYHHIPAWQIKERVSPRVWQNYHKFCVERNPWEKVASGWNWYQTKYSVVISLDDYLAFCAPRIRARFRGVGVCPFNIVNYVDPQNGEVLVDQLIRYENLDEGLQSVFDRLGIPFSPPLSVHAKRGLRYKARVGPLDFTQSQRRLIEELFAEEFEMHGY